MGAVPVLLTAVPEPAGEAAGAPGAAAGAAGADEAACSEAARWPAIARVAALAPADAPKLLTISPVCAAVVAPRVQPLAIPEPTIAPSIVGINRYSTIGVTAASRKHTNPAINVPTAEAASLITDPVPAPTGWEINFTAATRQDQSDR